MTGDCLESHQSLRSFFSNVKEEGRKEGSGGGAVVMSEPGRASGGLRRLFYLQRAYLLPSPGHACLLPTTACLPACRPHTPSPCYPYPFILLATTFLLPPFSIADHVVVPVFLYLPPTTCLYLPLPSPTLPLLLRLLLPPAFLPLPCTTPPLYITYILLYLHIACYLNTSTCHALQHFLTHHPLLYHFCPLIPLLYF